MVLLGTGGNDGWYCKGLEVVMDGIVRDWR